MSVDIAGLGSIATAAKGIVDKFWPDKTELEKAKLAAAVQESMNEFNLVSGQLEINKIEAAHSSIFVAGWRPFIGWVCGAGLAYQFLLMPFSNGLLVAFSAKAAFPTLDVATLTSCVAGLLGLGSLRTFEKYTGTEGRR